MKRREIEKDIRDDVVFIIGYSDLSYQDRWTIEEDNIEYHMKYGTVEVSRTSIEKKDIDVKFKQIYAPHCRFFATVDLKNRDEYTVLLNSSRCSSLEDYQKTKCLNLFNNQHKNRVHTFVVDRLFHWNCPDEEDYVYGTVETMLSVFHKENRLSALVEIFRRCDNYCNAIMFKFPDRYIYSGNYSAVMTIKQSKDIVLLYCMFHFIHELSFFEHLIAIFYFNEYGIVELKSVSKEMVEKYLENFEETVELKCLIDLFKEELKCIFNTFCQDIHQIQKNKQKYLYDNMTFKN